MTIQHLRRRQSNNNIGKYYHLVAARILNKKRMKKCPNRDALAVLVCELLHQKNTKRPKIVLEEISPYLTWKAANHMSQSSR